MIISPIQNFAILKNSDWFQKRSRKIISQLFGKKLYIKNIDIYRQWGMRGHNGLDYGVPTGTPVFAPFSGFLKVKNEGKKGYGLYIKLRSPERKLEACLAHLSRARYLSGIFVKMGDCIGWSGNSGFSTGAHLHFGLRSILKTFTSDIFSWQILNKNNGFLGYFDQFSYCIEWKGNHSIHTLRY